MSASDKKSALESVISPFNVSNSVLNLFVVLTKNKRLSAIPSLITECHRIKDRLTNYHRFVLQSSEQLSANQMATLKQELQSIGIHKVEITESIDSSLVFGFRLLSESHVYDMSLKSMLNGFINAIEKSN